MALNASSAARSRSTKTARFAPRESASIPSAPVPANRSSTRSSATVSNIEKIASFTRSDVGRVVALPFGACSRLPPKRPAITLTPRPGF